jgi:hypothetical protein
MKSYHILLIAVINILLMILFFPYWELFLFILFIVLVLIYRHYAVDKPHYGPYIYFSQDPGRILILNWIGVKPELRKLRHQTYVEVSKDLDFNPAKFYQGTYSVDLEDRTYYHIRIEDLEPKTKYYYRIGMERGKLVFSGKQYHFTTGPDSQDSYEKSPRIAIYGDDQTVDWIPIMAQFHNHYLYKDTPDFCIHLGDINQRIYKKQENNSFWQTKRKLFRTIPYMPVIGNHDYPTVEYQPPDDAWKFYEAFYNIPHWYAFNYGKSLKFIILSCEETLEPNTNGQYEFFEEELKKAQEELRFAIVCSHSGPYNIEHIINPPEERIEQTKRYLVPLFEKYNKGLQRNIVFFSGHEHTYERVVKNNMTYLTVGACSNSKYHSKMQDTSEKKYIPSIAQSEYGRPSYALLEIIGDELIIKIRGLFGKTVETLKFSL